MTEEQMEEIVIEEIRKATSVRSFRFLSLNQQRKVIDKAIRRALSVQDTGSDAPKVVS